MHTAIANSVYRSIVTRSSKFYYFLGKTKPYPIINGLEQVETPLPTYKYELSTRKDIILMNQITPTDVSFVIPRVNWESGQVFDQYDDFYSSTFPSNSGATSLETSKFYVLTGAYNLYICLDNNNNSISTILPSGSDTIPVKTADGYKWKYIMTIPAALRVKFLTSFYIPITTSINSGFYNNGAISSITIDNSGSGYTENTTAAITITNGTTIVTALVTGRTYAIASLGDTTNINWNTLAGTTTALTISNFIGNNTTTVTGTVASNAGFIVGDTIVISGATGTEQTKLNGTWTIASLPAGGTSFTFVVATAVSATGSPFTTTIGTTTKYKTYATNSIVTPVALGTGTGTLKGTGAILKPRISSVNGSVFKVDIVSGGTGYAAGTTLSVTGTGTLASVSPVITNGIITFVQILAPGSGYHVNNTSLSITTDSDSGSGAQITAIVENNTIVDTIIDNGGSGYRSAKLTAVNNLGGVGTGAKFSVVCSGGELETAQSNVELLAINGSIENIYVNNQGSGYSNATVTITGDGSGATATATIVNNKIVKINITNSGSNYTYATVTITASVSIPTILASARAIISPYYGHGKNVIRELFTNTLMFYSEIANTNTNNFTFNNDYRQFGIIKQPNSYGLQSTLQDSFGYACYIVEGTVANGTLVDDLVLVDTLGNEFVVVTSVVISGSLVRTLLQPISNEVIIYGQVLSSGGLTYAISSVTNPKVDKYSGDLLYINNKTSFFQTDSQSVTLQTVLKF